MSPPTGLGGPFPLRLPWPCEQPASARWGGAQAASRPAQGADGQRRGARCLEGHHALGPQRVHLLGRGCQAGDDPRAPHSPDPGGAGGRPAPALLLAGVQAPRACRQVARRMGTRHCTGTRRGGSRCVRHWSAPNGRPSCLATESRRAGLYAFPAVSHTKLAQLGELEPPVRIELTTARLQGG